MFGRRSTKQAEREAAESLARSLSSTALDHTAQKSPQTTTPKEPANERKLTRGAKFIAFYVLFGSMSALNWMRGVAGSVTSVHGVTPAGLLALATTVSGLAGAIWLFRKDRRAKPAFLVWTACIFTANALGGGGAEGEPLWFRIAVGAMVAGVFLLINREVDRNVGDKDED